MIRFLRPKSARDKHGGDRSRPPERKPLSRGKKIVFTLIVVAGLLGFIEAIASIYYFHHYSQQLRDGLEQVLGIKDSSFNTVLRYRAHPYFNYVCNPDYRYPDGYRPYNSHGFRKPEWPDTKPEDTLRIVALGGSTTYGIFSKRGDDVWPALLQKILGSRTGEKIEVFNLGVAAYTTNEILGVAAMLLPVLSPDVVLIHVGANEAFAAAYPDEGGPDNTRFRHVWSFRRMPPFWSFAMRKSYAVRVAVYTLSSRRGFVPGDIIPAMQYPHPNSRDATRQGKLATGKYFRSHVSVIIALVRNAGAIPILITHPLNPDWRAPDNPFYRVVTEAHKRNNRILVQIAAEKKVRIVELHKEMQSGFFYLDAIHMSKLGMKIKAEIIANNLEAWLGKTTAGPPPEE